MFLPCPIRAISAPTVGLQSESIALFWCDVNYCLWKYAHYTKSDSFRAVRRRAGGASVRGVWERRRGVRISPIGRGALPPNPPRQARGARGKGRAAVGLSASARADQPQRLRAVASVRPHSVAGKPTRKYKRRILELQRRSAATFMPDTKGRYCSYDVRKAGTEPRQGKRSPHPLGSDGEGRQGNPVSRTRADPPTDEPQISLTNTHRRARRHLCSLASDNHVPRN